MFNLRTLFVVVTVVGCWLGYELNWIRQRHELVAEHEARFSRAVWGGHVPLWSEFHESHKAPGCLSLFGEKGARQIELIFLSDEHGPPNAEEQSEISQARRLFPEAEIGWNRLSRKPVP